MFRQPELSVVLFFFCLATFGWPFISIPGAGSPEAMYYYLFVMWGVVILLLLFLARANEPRNRDDQPQH